MRKIKYEKYIIEIKDKNTTQLSSELNRLINRFPSDNKQKGGNYNFKYFYNRINFFNKKYNNPDGKIYKIVKIGGNNENIEDLLKDLLKDFKILYINALEKLISIEKIYNLEKEKLKKYLINNETSKENKKILEEIINIIIENPNFINIIQPYSSFSIEKE